MLRSDQGEYAFVEAEDQRIRLSVGFLGVGGSLVVEVKEARPQQPLPRRLQPRLPLNHRELPVVVPQYRIG